MDWILPIFYTVFWIAIFCGVIGIIWGALYLLKKKQGRLPAQPQTRSAVSASHISPGGVGVMTLRGNNAAPPRPAPLAVQQPTTPALPASQSLAVWLRRANDEPDRCPHLAVTGPSGSGKSTLILALLTTRPGRVLICTPKSKRADGWAGLPVVRLRAEDMSFEPIKEAILSVYNEMLRRNAQDADVDDDWLTLVIDEYSTVIGKLADLKEKVLDMVTLGRSARIRVIIGATETNVKAWGWEGRGEARGNVLFIECEEDTYCAFAFRWGKERTELDTRRVPEVADRGIPLNRWWTPPQAQPKRQEVPLPVRPRHQFLAELLDADTETDSKPFQSIETPETALQRLETTMPSVSVDTFQALARLVKAGLLTETKALETTFGVRAGSSKAYQDVRAKFKQAIAQLDVEEESTEAKAA